LIEQQCLHYASFKFIKKNGRHFQIGLLENTCTDQCSEIVSGSCNFGPQVKLSAHLMCVHYNIAFDHMGPIWVRRACLSVLPMQSVISLISSTSSNKNTIEWDVHLVQVLISILLESKCMWQVKCFALGGGGCWWHCGYVFTCEWYLICILVVILDKRRVSTPYLNPVCCTHKNLDRWLESVSPG